MNIEELIQILEKYPKDFKPIINIGGEFVEIDKDSIECIDNEKLVQLMEIS